MSRSACVLPDEFGPMMTTRPARLDLSHVRDGDRLERIELNKLFHGAFVLL